jgi:hypothetical protein
MVNETRYSHLTDNEVNDLYRSDVWNNLPYDAKMDALQELENRAAENVGNSPCQVNAEYMEGSMFGGYDPRTGDITINKHLIESGNFVTHHDDGTVSERSVRGLNAELVDTVNHENYHAYQNEVISGSLQHDNAAEAELWKANDLLYIDPDDPSDTYRIQALERSAFAHGEAETRKAFQEMETRYGVEDAGFKEYQESLQAHSYEKAVATAQNSTGISNIEQALDQQMLDAYHAVESDEAFASEESTASDVIIADSDEDSDFDSFSL